MTDVDAVAFAIIRRIGDLLTIEVEPGEVDLYRSLVSADGFSIGHYEFDSLDVVNVFVALEEDLGVKLLDSGGRTDTDTLEKLSRFVLETADPRRLVDFSSRWS